MLALSSSASWWVVGSGCQMVPWSQVFWQSQFQSITSSIAFSLCLALNILQVECPLYSPTLLLLPYIPGHMRPGLESKLLMVFPLCSIVQSHILGQLAHMGGWVAYLTVILVQTLLLCASCDFKFFRALWAKSQITPLRRVMFALKLPIETCLSFQKKIKNHTYDNSNHAFGNIL